MYEIRISQVKISKELHEGEKSGFSENFNPKTFKENLHQKYIAE